MKLYTNKKCNKLFQKYNKYKNCINENIMKPP